MFIICLVSRMNNKESDLMHRCVPRLMVYLASHYKLPRRFFHESIIDSFVHSSPDSSIHVCHEKSHFSDHSINFFNNLGYANRETGM